MDEEEDDEFQLREYGTHFFVAFLHARIICSWELLEMCEVFDRMPNRRGKIYKKLMREMEGRIELIKDTMDNEVEA